MTTWNLFHPINLGISSMTRFNSALTRGKVSLKSSEKEQVAPKTKWWKSVWQYSSTQLTRSSGLEARPSYCMSTLIGFWEILSLEIFEEKCTLSWTTGILTKLSAKLKDWRGGSQIMVNSSIEESTLNQESKLEILCSLKVFPLPHLRSNRHLTLHSRRSLSLKTANQQPQFGIIRCIMMKKKCWYSPILNLEF